MKWMNDLTDKWSDSRSENRAALHNECHSSSDKNGNVTCDPAEWKWEICTHKQTHNMQVLLTNTFPFISLHLSVRCHSPVLRIFLMTEATCPFSMELSSLTMSIRQEQSTSRERASRIRPTARSGRFTFTKICLPEDKQKHMHQRWLVSFMF